MATAQLMLYLILTKTKAHIVLFYVLSFVIPMENPEFQSPQQNILIQTVCVLLSLLLLPLPVVLSLSIPPCLFLSFSFTLVFFFSGKPLFNLCGKPLFKYKLLLFMIFYHHFLGKLTNFERNIKNSFLDLAL